MYPLCIDTQVILQEKLLVCFPVSSIFTVFSKFSKSEKYVSN